MIHSYLNCLNTLCENKFFTGVVYTDQGEVQEVSLFQIFFEKIKGLFGYEDHSNQKIVAYHAMTFLCAGIEKGFLGENEQVLKVVQFVKRVGLVAENTDSTSIEDLVSEIAQNLFLKGLIRERMEGASLQNLLESYRVSLSPELKQEFSCPSADLDPIFPVQLETISDTVSIEIEEKEDRPPIEEIALTSSWNWKTAKKVVLIASAVLLLAGLASYVLNPVATEEEIYKALNPICQKAVEDYCVCNRGFGTVCAVETGPCLKDYLDPKWTPSVYLEDDLNFLCPVYVLSKNCSALIAPLSGLKEPNRFYGNFEPIRPKTEWLMQMPSYIVRGFKQFLAVQGDSFERFRFKSHIRCSETSVI